MMDLHALYGWLCHQIPERSPYYDAATFPLCFRCAGLHLGFFCALVYLARSGGFWRSIPPPARAVPVALLAAPHFVDGWANFLGAWDTPGPLRAALGVLAGIITLLFLVPLALGPDDPADLRVRPCLPRLRGIAALLTCGVGCTILLAIPPSTAAFAVLSAAAAAGTLAFGLLLLVAAGRLAAARLLPRPASMDVQS